jgi:hypothetical protein
LPPEACAAAAAPRELQGTRVRSDAGKPGFSPRHSGGGEAFLTDTTLLSFDGGRKESPLSRPEECCSSGGSKGAPAGRVRSVSGTPGSPRCSGGGEAAFLAGTTLPSDGGGRESPLPRKNVAAAAAQESSGRVRSDSGAFLPRRFFPARTEMVDAWTARVTSCSRPGRERETKFCCGFRLGQRQSFE